MTPRKWIATFPLAAAARFSVAHGFALPAERICGTGKSGPSPHTASYISAGVQPFGSLTPQHVVAAQVLNHPGSIIISIDVGLALYASRYARRNGSVAGPEL